MAKYYGGEPSQPGPLVAVEGVTLYCARCGSRLAAGDLVVDQDVMKCGELDYIETRHAECPTLPDGYHAGPNHLHGFPGRQVYRSDWNRHGRMGLPPTWQAWQEADGTVTLRAVKFDQTTRSHVGLVIKAGLSFQQLDDLVALFI